MASNEQIIGLQTTKPSGLAISKSNSNDSSPPSEEPMSPTSTKKKRDNSPLKV